MTDKKCNDPQCCAGWVVCFDYISHPCHLCLPEASDAWGNRDIAVWNAYYDAHYGKQRAIGDPKEE